MNSDWVIVAGTLAGVVVGGAIDLGRSVALERRQERADQCSRNRASLLALLNALDDLQNELSDIPQPGYRHDIGHAAFAAILPNASFTLDRMWRRLAQPNLPSIVSRAQDAMNRAILELPEEMLDPIAPVAELLRDWKPQDMAWSDRWTRSVTDLRVRAREFVS